MATPVTQYTSPDPSLSANPNFGSFTQYLITGTNYITDSKAQVVYEFQPTVPGVLTNTDGSYTQFLAYLTANPVTSTLPNPQGAAGGPATFGFPYNFQNVPALPGNSLTAVYDQRMFELLENILLELRSMRLATVSMAIQGGQADEADFDPTFNLAFSGSGHTAFN